MASRSDSFGSGGVGKVERCLRSSAGSPHYQAPHLTGRSICGYGETLPCPLQSDPVRMCYMSGMKDTIYYCKFGAGIPEGGDVKPSQLEKFVEE